MYPKESQAAHKRDTCTPTFVAALFTTAELWNHLGAHLLMNRYRKCATDTHGVLLSYKEE
jgi:hypothetical protein